MVGGAGKANEAEQASTEQTSTVWPQWWGWVLVGLLLVVEYGLFREYVVREIAWGYPAHRDQEVYLTYSYLTYEQILTHGLMRGIKFGLWLPASNGTMLPLQASLLYLVLGPSRLTALTLNFLYFAMLQCVLVGTVRWYGRRWSMALAALGLLLATTALAQAAGGLMDFRIDCIACCLFGVFVSLVMRSRLFASWRWSVAVGAAAGMLVAFRFLTLIYLTGILGSFFVFVVAGLYARRRDVSARRYLLRQLRGLLTAGAILLLLAGPLIYSNLAYILNYYVGAITSGDSAMRNQEFGVHDMLDRLVYYPRSVIRDHAGPTFLALAGVLLVAALAVRRFQPAASPGTLLRTEPGRAAAALFAVACLLIPVVTLTLYASTSPVVGGIVVTALVWLVVLIALGPKPQDKPSTPGSLRDPLWITTLAAIMLMKGFWTYAVPLCKRGWMTQHRADIEHVLELNDEIYFRSRQLGLAQPAVSCNFMCDYLPAFVQPSLYERRGVLFHPRYLMPHADPGRAFNEAEALAAIEKSDFVILNMANVPEGAAHPFRNSVYPFMRPMYDMRPKLLAECEKRFDPVKHFSLFGDDIVLYMRRQASGESAGAD